MSRSSTHLQLRHLRLRLLGFALGSAIACAAAGAGEPPADVQVPSQPGRPLGSRTREPAALLALQGRLDSITAAANAPGCGAVYAANKAQAWLNFSEYAAAEQLPAADRTAGLRNAAALIESLERHADATHETPELPGAHRVRDDLWQAVAAVERDGRVCAAPKMTAYCEVELAWMDYEAGAGGRRHVDPYVRIAEDYCSSAIAARPLPAPSAAIAHELATPAADTDGSGSVATAAAPPAAPAPAKAAPEDLAVTVLFPHNRARRADIRPAGRSELRRLAGRLSSLPAGTTITVVGHADLTGHPDYNLRLSEQRARSVVQELRRLGVHGVRIRIAARGSSVPVIECPLNDRVADRRRYLACLEPNRRVVVHLVINSPGR
jgi:outer membrane protein OmpA-like peptidoglycan-associated protein